MPTQVLVHASRINCVSEGTACAQKTFSVPGTGGGLPTATSAQKCFKLACSGICLVWWQWIPNNSLPKAPWKRRKTAVCFHTKPFVFRKKHRQVCGQDVRVFLWRSRERGSCLSYWAPILTTLGNSSSLKCRYWDKSTVLLLLLLPSVITLS